MARIPRGLHIPAALGALALDRPLLTALSDAQAKTAFDSPYTLDQTYKRGAPPRPGRFGLKVTERDPQAAYVMFEYQSTKGGAPPCPARSK